VDEWKCQSHSARRCVHATTGDPPSGSTSLLWSTGRNKVCLMVDFPSLLNASFQVKQRSAQPHSYSKSSMSFLTTSIVFLVFLTSLSDGSPLPTSPLKPGTAKSWTNATYVSSIDQCPPLSPRRTPPTSVHDLLVIVTSLRHPLVIGFS
jgi:hypothetical protein